MTVRHFRDDVMRVVEHVREIRPGRRVGARGSGCLLSEDPRECPSPIAREPAPLAFLAVVGNEVVRINTIGKGCLHTR